MNKDVGEIFKEKLEGFEAQPQGDLWNKIQQNSQWKRHLHSQTVKNLIIYGIVGLVAITTSIVLIHSRIDKSDSIPHEILSDEKELVVKAETNQQDIVTDIIATEEVTETQTEIPESEISVSEPTPEPAVNEEVIANPVEPALSKTTVQESPSIPSSTTNTNSSKPIQTKTDNTKAQTEIQTNSNSTSTTPPPAAAKKNLLSIPNAFTPNGDGLNDIFAPVTEDELQTYQLEIYSRTGQKLFSSRDIHYGWNGEFQGSMMNGGNYIYLIKYKDSEGQEHIDKGQLLLIR